jgi:hypothetical protein
MIDSWPKWVSAVKKSLLTGNSSWDRGRGTRWSGCL